MAQLPFTFRGNKAAASKANEAPQRAERTGPTVLTVSELQRRLRLQLEDQYRAVLVTGEISNFQHHRSGHAYFTLKDDKAQLKCVMWSDALGRLRFTPADGLAAIARGRVTIYERGGTLQMNVHFLEPKGVGALQLQFRELADKLRKEGLTAPDRKRPLPPYPRTIGVVTSRSAAALRDVLRTILRRDPFAQVLIAHSPVQGQAAGRALAAAIRRVDGLNRAEVIIVARGGGSMEDLWAFNEEVVARAIVGTNVPVVTGIGHETDTTIADLVADVRASTPTAAAEQVVPQRTHLRQRWLELEARLARHLTSHIQRHSRRLLQLQARLRDPAAALRRHAQFLDELTNRAERAMAGHVHRRRRRLDGLTGRLAARAPASRLQRTQHRLQSLQARLDHGVQRCLEARRQRLSLSAGRLQSLSPLNVLARGYALVQTEDGAVVKDSAQAMPGEQIRIRLQAGRLTAQVLTTEPGDNGDEPA